MDFKHLPRQDLEPYQYQPLPTKSSIRLLEVWKDLGGDPSKSTFKIVEEELSGIKGRYRALSYAWEGQQPSEWIEIQESEAIGGARKSLKLAVTKNVGDALRRFQTYEFVEHEDDREIDVFAIWIDAICINQGDLTERSQQVTMMREIFKLADCVYIWLGRGTQLSDKVMSKLRWCQDIRDLLWSKNLKIRWFDQRFMKRFIDLDGEVVPSLGQRSYWQRIWTLQEVTNANVSIYYGDAAPIRLSTLFDAVQTGDGPLELSRNWITSHFLWQRYHEENLERFLTLDRVVNVAFLALAQEKLAKDPSDKIYALRGAGVWGLQSVPVDYSRPVSSTYHLATKAIISESRSLLLFTCGDFISENEIGVPSWTMDFSRSMPFVRIGPRVLYFDMAASKKSHATFRFENDDMKLKVKGLVIDTICFCFEANPACPNKAFGPSRSPYEPLTFEDYWESEIPMNDIRHVRYWQRRAQIWIDEDVSCTVWRSLLRCGIKPFMHHFEEITGLETTMSWFRMAFQDLFGDEARAIEIIQGTLQKSKELRRMQWAIFHSLQGQYIFITQKGHWLGMSTAPAKIDDRLCLLSGLSCPVLLRKDARSDKSWRMVGPTSIGDQDDGVMEGFLWPEDESQLEDIIIA